MARRNRLLSFVDKISFGLFIVLFMSWMYLRADVLFPTNPTLWKGYITTYILLVAFVFSWNAISSRKTEEVLFRVGFLRELPKFLLGAGISFAILFVAGYLIKGQALPTIKTALSTTLPIVLILYTLVVAISEELIFRGFVPNELKARKVSKVGIYVIQAVLFAFFHWFVSGSAWTLLIYIPLGLIFMWAKDRFSPATNMTNISMHVAWNVFILGFMS